MRQSNNRRDKLMALGVEVLADGLLELAVTQKAAADLIVALLSSSDAGARHFETQLLALKRSRRYVDWRGSREFGDELYRLLDNLKRTVKVPRLGVQSVALFFEADKFLFDLCDDSHGDVGMAFQYAAEEILPPYAKGCEDQDWVMRVLYKLTTVDEYGARDCLLRCIDKYLPASEIRRMVDLFWKRGQGTSFGRMNDQAFGAIRSIATCIKDAGLHEKACLALWPGDPPSAHVCVKIAEVYLDCGSAQQALEWLDRVPATDTTRTAECNSLRAQIQKALGKRRRTTKKD